MGHCNLCFAFSVHIMSLINIIFGIVLEMKVKKNK